jgi:hypothetical protein
VLPTPPTRPPSWLGSKKPCGTGKIATLETSEFVRRTLALLEELHGPCRLVEADRVNLMDLLAECEREWREANVKKAEAIASGDLLT